MKIRHKILLTYLSIFFTFFVLFFWTVGTVRWMQRSYNELIEHRVRTVSRTKDLLSAVEYEALMLRTYLLTGRKEYETEFRRQAQQVNRLLTEIEKDLDTEQERVLFNGLKRTVTGFTEVYAETILAVRQRPDLTDQEKLAEVIRLTVAKRGTIRGVIAQGEDFIAYQQKLMDEAAAATAARVKQIMTITLVLGLLGLLLGTVVALYISRTIADPVRQLEEQVNRIARGDLTPRELEITSRDEIGQLARSFGVMFTNLHRLAGQLQAAVEEVSRLTADLQLNTREAAAASANTTAALNRTTTAIQNLTARNQVLFGLLDRTLEQAQKVQETTGIVLQQMEFTAKTAARASKAVRDLSAALDDVRQATDFVSQFAEQADLLLEKAATELSPEDSDKQGVFLDLVHEIRMRAREADRGTKEVIALIATAQEHTREAVSSVDEDCRLVGEGRRAMKKAIEAFATTIEEVRAIMAQLEQTASAARDFSAALQEVTQISEVQTALIAKVANATSTLENLTGELRKTLSTLQL
jgi:methyl-accepting chemotaxis protein